MSPTSPNTVYALRTSDALQNCSPSIGQATSHTQISLNYRPNATLRKNKKTIKMRKGV